MNRGKVTSLVSQIEEEFNVNDLKYNNVCIWPIIRTEIFKKLLTQVGTAEKENKKSFYKRFSDLYWINKDVNIDLKEILKKEKKDIVNSNRKLITAPILLYGISAHRTELINNKYFHRLFDSLEYYLKERQLGVNFIESIERTAYFPRYSNVTLIDKRLLADLKRHKMAKALFRFAFAIKHLDSFLELIESKYGKIISREEIEEKVIRVWVYCKRFKKILIKAKTKVLFVDIYYHDKSFAAVLAANMLGIKTVELQHGSQSKVHPAYCEWNKIRKDGYMLMPQYFWLWTQREKTSMSNWIKNTQFHKYFVGGNPYMTLVQNRRLDYHYDKLKVKSELKVLFSLQELLKEEIRILEKIIIPFIKENKKIFWIIRLHPCYIESQIIWLKEKIKPGKMSNVIIQHPKEPLYFILKQVDFHVTFYSTVAIEAHAFGVRNILFGTNARGFFGDQIDSGEFFLLNSKEEMEKVLNKKNRIKENNVEINIEENKINEIISLLLNDES